MTNEGCEGKGGAGGTGKESAAPLVASGGGGGGADNVDFEALTGPWTSTGYTPKLKLINVWA